MTKVKRNTLFGAAIALLINTSPSAPCRSAISTTQVMSLTQFYSVIFLQAQGSFRFLKNVFSTTALQGVGPLINVVSAHNAL